MLQFRETEECLSYNKSILNECGAPTIVFVGVQRWGGAQSQRIFQNVIATNDKQPVTGVYCHL